MNDKSPPPSDTANKFMLRLPDGMRERLKEVAKKSGRSMNAEIVQRLGRTFDNESDDRLKLDLPPDSWNALLYDAHAHGQGMEERALQILSGAYDQNVAPVLEKLQTTFSEKIDLEDKLAALKARQDVDFLLYFTKASQLTAFARQVALSSDVPNDIAQTAKELLELSEVETETLGARYRHVVRTKKGQLEIDEVVESTEPNERK